MDKCREAFEQWFKTTKAYQMLKEMNYFNMDLFHFVDARNEYRHSSVQIAFMTWQSRQAEVDRLNDVLDERTKEWLEAIELGTYFQDAAKPLKDEVDEKDKRITRALNFINNWWHPDLDQKLFVEAVGKALRGEHE